MHAGCKRKVKKMKLKVIASQRDKYEVSKDWNGTEKVALS